jgi:acyl-coenzyme A thioesterase PaaI-like protein
MLHGGVLLDECMGLASFTVLPNHIGVTASLEIAYQSPIHIPGVIYIEAVVERSEGRKAWVAATIQNPDRTTVFAKAKALFIEPRGAQDMNQLI